MPILQHWPRGRWNHRETSRLALGLVPSRMSAGYKNRTGEANGTFSRSSWRRSLLRAVDQCRILRESLQMSLRCGTAFENPVTRAVACRYNAPVLEVVPGMTIKRSEEHTSELQSLMRISYAVFCLKKNNQKTKT